MRYTTPLMKITTRVFAFLAISAVVAALLPAQPADKPGAKKNYLVFVGTYTTKTASKGIYAFHYDATSGKLTPMGVAAETQDPSWVAIHRSGKFLYAANEAGKNSMVSAFSLDAKSGKLTLLNQVPALGEDPCYLSFDRSGRYLLAANYTSGNVVVFPIQADGKLGSATANVRDQGTLGPNKERQKGPHAHWIEADARNRAVLVADLGLDSILIYGFDAKTGKLAAAASPYDFCCKIKLAPGTGPRHAFLCPTEDCLYVLGELGSTVTVCLPSAVHLFQCAWSSSTLPPDFKGRNDAAEIASYPGGTWLFASNRGHDSIAVFDVRDEPLRLVADVPTGGKEPRHFAIDPSGNFLLAEDQLSDKIVTFRIDQKTGALTPTGDSVEVPSPVCLAFLPVD